MEGNMYFYQYRWLDYAILLMTGLILASPIKAADEIVGFRALSESQDKLVLEIQSYYTGSQGAMAYLSVLPTINGQLASGIGYSAGSCPNSNNISTGPNSSCMTLSSVKPGNQVVTNGLEICMFGGSSRNKFYCKSFAYTKRWGSSNGPAQPMPGRAQSDLQIRNVSIYPDPLVQSRIQLHMYRSYRIQVSILNGGASSPDFTVRTECNRNGMNHKLGETRVGPIPQSQTRDAVYDIFPSSAGAGGCIMRTTVDADRQVNESDESPLSNSWDRAVTILR